MATRDANGPNLYARLECVKRNGSYQHVEEPLVDHLVDSAVAACILARRISPDAMEPATLAAAIHDIGKVLHSLLHQRRINKIVRSGCRGRVETLDQIPRDSIRGYLRYYAEFHERRPQSDNAIVTRAVLLHHQGLKGLATRVYLDGLAWISNQVARLSKS